MFETSDRPDAQRLRPYLVAPQNNPRSTRGMEYYGAEGRGLSLCYFGARLARILCKVRRCIWRRRAVSETLRLQSSKILWICSQRTRSADMGFSGGSALRPSAESSAATTSSASTGLDR